MSRVVLVLVTIEQKRKKENNKNTQSWLIYHIN